VSSILEIHKCSGSHPRLQSRGVAVTRADSRFVASTAGGALDGAASAMATDLVDAAEATSKELLATICELRRALADAEGALTSLRTIADLDDAAYVALPCVSTLTSILDIASE
jgi:hypothetical protein